ncbi:MFS transporter [Alistipes sp. An116]|uniref:MFS transporter n=1 Tax=Alistipes sp. An116 TaxID=1965546 RepID=UPI000B37AE70|nr:MFS transporter [Alistipes sp. An116]OUQ53333.1 MFS transporter [Alistipes sp. An116]
MSILSYFRKSEPSAPFAGDDEARMRLYRKLRLQSFIAGTVGYSLYYVCRTSLNVVKQPILESGALDASQLGLIGSALLFAYAIGKFVNGFLADHSNIKRFMAAGLCVSAVANLLVGLLGLANGGGMVGNMTLFVVFAVMWGLNGWAQSMGAPPAIIALSRWYPLSIRGTFYGFFSASHNLGEFLSFLFVGAVVGICGWQWGFVGSSLAGVIGVVIIVCLLHDTPESKGLPPIGVLTGEETAEESHHHASTSELQRSAIRNPLVWVLALSSAFMYVSRYAINGWGVLFLQEAKGYSLAAATQVISVNALLGILGTVFSGWLSDRLFHGRRNVLASGFGVLNTLALALFLYSGNGMFVNLLSMVFFGMAIGVLICFLGGLMAIDIVPREATGAALGIVGMASYVGAGLQDIISGWLIDSGKEVVDGVTRYDFSTAAVFWIAASALSFILALFVARRSRR